jgi:hypothetical protein
MIIRRLCIASQPRDSSTRVLVGTFADEKVEAKSRQLEGRGAGVDESCELEHVLRVKARTRLLPRALDAMADIAAVRVELKTWEREFKSQHGRDPSVQDIKTHPEIGVVRYHQFRLPYSWLTSGILCSSEIQTL